MKMLSTGCITLLGVVLAGVGIADAVRETLLVTERGVEFTVVAFNDDRNRPHRIRFAQDGTQSSYTFNRANQVTTSRVGTERYTFRYDSNDNLESINLTSPSTRRALLADEENYAAEIVGRRRLDFADCADCEAAFEAVCDGIFSVCDLLDFGPAPFSATAAASVETACSPFRTACSRFQPNVACFGQCTPEEIVIGDSSSNPCLDPSSEDYKCKFSGETSIEFTNCDLTNGDVPFLPPCFEEFGRTNIVSLDMDNGDFTALPEDTFVGLSELTSLDLFRSRLVTVPEGLFDGLTKLEFLDLAFNTILLLPEGAFSELENLETLRLFNNALTPETIPLSLFSGTPKLKELFLSRNNLRDMTELVGLFDGLAELVVLGLGEGGTVTVPEGLFAGLTKLERLSFFRDNINNLPDGVFADLASLRTLDLTDNDLTGYGASLSGLTELRTLRTDFNPLQLTEDSFSGLVNLETLVLEGARLTTLPAGLFSPLVNLVDLRLIDNEDLQCVPSTTATDISLDVEETRNGTCECTPVEAVFCDDGLTCQSGMNGYTCVAN